MGTIRQGIVRRPVPGGGNKLYAAGLHYSRITDAELINYMLQNSQVGRATAVAAVEAFKAVFSTFLLNGHTITVPALGTFSLTCNSDTKKVTITPPENTDTPANKKEMSAFRQQVADAIENFNIRYTPTARTRMAAKSVRFQGIIVED